MNRFIWILAAFYTSVLPFTPLGWKNQGWPIVEPFGARPHKTNAPRMSLAASSLFFSTPNESKDCTYSRDAMMALDWKDFDQDLDGGWRPLARKGCNAEAADLIREWRFEKRNYNSVLFWHEGQLRARMGETKEAVALFRLTYKSIDEDANFGWNHYVDGTIAFLVKDRERLDRAIERLEEIPEPNDLSTTMPEGVGKMNWPPNMKVLQAFERCWTKSYRDAYGAVECTVPEPIE